jgi:phosphohistidine swiveling domain-containing protein
MGGKARNLHQLLAAGFPIPPGFVLFETAPDYQQAIEAIGGFPVAVRSSGALEDLENASFAGLYETILFVNSPEELRQAIQQCFDSRNSERVKDYLDNKKIKWSPDDLTMSVLVQKMVSAQVAGVLFTLNPLNGREEEIYLELCQGVGERLVSGHVTPTSMRYNWVEQQIVSEAVNDEGTRLSSAQLKELIEISLKIQAFYGAPQDIEWALGPDQKIYILQSRPITSYTPREDRPELTNADFKDGGISARVCTHLMYSVYRDALRTSMGAYFKRIRLIPNDEEIQWTYYHYGRVYWNAGAVKEGLKKIPAFREEDFDRDLGIQKDYGAKGPHITRVDIASVVNAIPVVMALYQEFADCSLMIDGFRGRFELRDAELKSSLRELSRLSSQDFARWLLDVINFQQETEKNYFRTIYNNTNFQSEFKSFLKKLKAYSPGDEIDLMGELHGVSHLDVQGSLAKLARDAEFYGLNSDTYYRGREKFLQTHYHHGPAELDLTVPRWGEKKEWVDDLVRAYIPSTAATPERLAPAVEKLSVGLSMWKRRKLKRLLDRSRDFLRVREEMRSYSTRAYYLLRLGILEFARRWGLTEMGVFMLDISEIRQALIKSGASLPETTQRTTMYQGYRHFVPPNEFGGSIQMTTTSNYSGELRGLGCSPGEIVGRARVVLDIHATAQLTRDEILVTKFTDPGWTPVLARVGGVITEVGGLLSHAAVIGREYGIPAILNLIDATKLIQDGDLIKMNGKTGVVEILEKSS